MLKDLLPEVPSRYGKYIEPFVGGGALFFALQPERAVISDWNPELVNLYRAVALDVDAVIDALRPYENTEEMFYATRSLDWHELDASEAAARTIYLNRTCFNGLYRQNRSGGFNVPFARYKNPKILDEPNLRAAATALGRATIQQGDAVDVLREHAEEGDVIFLDPPYLPVVDQATNFSQYTKDGYSVEDHQRLAAEVDRLVKDVGCTVLYTNANNDLVSTFFPDYRVEVIETRRNINRLGSARRGQDILVVATPDMVAAT